MANGSGRSDSVGQRLLFLVVSTFLLPALSWAQTSPECYSHAERLAQLRADIEGLRPQVAELEARVQRERSALERRQQREMEQARRANRPYFNMCIGNPLTCAGSTTPWELDGKRAELENAKARLDSEAFLLGSCEQAARLQQEQHVVPQQYPRPEASPSGSFPVSVHSGPAISAPSVEDDLSLPGDRRERAARLVCNAEASDSGDDRLRFEQVWINCMAQKGYFLAPPSR
jgi:hypothetical protein